MPEIPAPAHVAVSARFVADPSSVPHVRSFVVQEIGGWGRPGLVDDAELCVSELAANAVLHSDSTFMEVALESLARGVRISVEDDGDAALESVTPRVDYSGTDPDFDLDMDLEDEEPADDEPTQGRGLAIVSFLASDWGVDQTAGGKRVWVELEEAVS